MKKILSLILTIIIFIPNIVTVFAVDKKPTNIISDSYVVMDSDTGQVLIEKNMNKMEYPASITKIMTLAIALENGKMADKMTVSSNAVSGFDSHDAHIALTGGEIATMEQLVYATQLMSANDAANVIAENIGGSIDEFVNMMNAKAKEIGCVNTHFVNANGLPDENHYTTAYDMSLITKYALSNPEFKKVWETFYYEMPPTNKQPEMRKFGTFHYMVVPSAYQYKYATGGKLGWTKPAKHTIVTTATKDGMNLICVAMYSPNKYDKYKDSIALFDYCFENFKKVKISKSNIKNTIVPVFNGEKNIYNLDVSSKNDISFCINNNYSPSDVNITYSIKDKYNYNEEMKPTISLSIKDSDKYMYGNILTLQLDTQKKDIPQVSQVKNFDIVLDKFLDIIIQVFNSTYKIVLVLIGIFIAIRIYTKSIFKHKNKSRIRKKVKNKKTKV